MEKRRRRAEREALIDEDKADLQKQIGIFLWTMTWMVILMVGLYMGLNHTAIISSVVILLVSTIGLYIKFKDFYEYRDRGQRTLCVVISMYCSLALTLVCVYYYVKDEPLTQDYALVFLFGWFFFMYMLYKSFARYMVVGNKRQRFRTR